MTYAEARPARWRLTGRRTRLPAAEALVIRRLRDASAGPARRAVIVGLLACIGERVALAAPSPRSLGRAAFERSRRAMLLRQLERIWDRRGS